MSAPAPFNPVSLNREAAFFDIEGDVSCLRDFSVLLVELFEPGTELSATAQLGVYRIVNQMRQSAEAIDKAWKAAFGGAA